MEYLRCRIRPEDLAHEDMTRGVLLHRCIAMSLHGAAIGRGYSLWKDIWASPKARTLYEDLNLEEILDIQEAFTHRRWNVQLASWRDHVIYKAAEKYADGKLAKSKRVQILDLL